MSTGDTRGRKRRARFAISGCERRSRSAKSPWSDRRRYTNPIDLTGQTLDGKYRIDGELGAGGMGAVFRATHLGTERPVALKIIAPRLMEDATSLERFKREARAAGRLQHPNIVNVTDFGIANVGGQHVAYLAMEYLEGFTLGELVERQKKLPVSLAVDILDQVAIAVDEAHRFGIIHRDLKPENIWLRPDRRGGYQVKVLDFGVATFRESAIAEESPAAVEVTAATTAVATPHLTRAGSVVGTPAYMSPEQCAGRAVTAHSDVYSLGVIAYRMITGELPFIGNTTEMIAKHIAAAPPEMPGVPRRIAEVVLRALEKSPDQRPISATAFAGALRARSEGPTLVMRRAIALFSIRADEFFRFVILCQAPLLIWIALTIPLFAIFGLRAAPAIFVTSLLGVPGEAANNWLVYLVIDQLRQHPLEPVSWREIIERLGDRTGAPGLRPTQLFRHGYRLMRLNSSVMRASFRENLGRSPSGFLVFAFIETGDAKRAVELTRGLGKEVSWRTRAVVYTFIAFLVLGLFGSAMLLALAPESRSLIAGILCIVVSLLLGFLAVVISPLAAIANAIFFFHARQALGEDVSFSMHPRL